jgi:hypothetical protein
MSLEYRKYSLTINQQAPSGSLGIGLSDGKIVWAGNIGTFPSSTYTSTVMSVQEVAQMYVKQLQSQTQRYIETYMPQWRLNRWRRYYDLRLKVVNNISLNTVEQIEYNCFPDLNETHDQCDVYVGPALEWCSLVVIEHSRVQFGMLAATTIEQILNIKSSLSYPAFVI